MDNKVVIIGGDHHNTLAIIRSFGKNKIPFKLIVHGDVNNKNDISILHSKYVKDSYIVNNDINLIINKLIEFKTEYKQFLVPCSDLAEYAIDYNYKELSDAYIMPGFSNKPGLVCKMMNKYEQKKWAEKNGILMAKSWLIQRKNSSFQIPNNLIYPCIVKPNISAFGKKSDIRIVNGREEFLKIIDNYNNDNNYDELIIQEFIKKEYELCAIGCIGLNKKCYGRVIKKIRENPPFGGGSLTFAKFIDDKKIIREVDGIIKKLVDEGYNGLYDIEFFKCGNKIYLNEINFRHSGNGYALIKSKIDAPYIWYISQSIKDKDITIKKIKGNNFYFIDDFNELSSLKNRYINIKIFICDFIKANAHSIFSFTDSKVFIFKIKNSIMNRKRR